MPERTLGYYESSADSLARRYEGAKVQELQKDLLENLKGRSPILEIGCGSGREAAFLQAQGFEVVATDGSPAMLEEAKRLHPELSDNARILQVPSRFPFDDDTFSAAYSIALLMHLDADDASMVLDEIWRVLCPEGLFYFSIPDRALELDEQGRDQKGRLVHILPREDWMEIFQRTGFRPLRQSEQSDGLGRMEIKWLSYVIEKMPRPDVENPRISLVW